MKYGLKKKTYARKMKKGVKKSNGIKTTKKVVNPMLKSIVKRLMRKESEVKTVTSTVFPVVGANGDIMGSGINNSVVPSYGITSLLPIIPPISQGTGQGQRIGNQISPVSLILRGIINALPTNSSNNNYPNQPFYVRVIVFCPRSNSTSNVIGYDLLDQGTTNVEFDGSLNDLLLPYNRDKYTILKSFQVNLQPVYDPVSTAGAIENTNKKVNHLFKIRIPLPKTLKYVDTLQDNSKTRYYMAAGVVNWNGNLLAQTDIRAKINCEAILKYRDS